jgi:hypothetical protein
MVQTLQLPILVRQGAFSNEDDKEIVSALIDEYVNPLIKEGYYSHSELPPNAMRSYHVDYYLAQVANGGHWQFMRNGNCRHHMLNNIEEGLAAIGLEPYIAVFDEFVEFLASDPQRAARAVESYPRKKDPTLEDLDKRFFALDCYKTLMPANGRWLKSLPELKVIPDADFDATIRKLIAANLGGKARKIAIDRPKLANKLQDAVEVAAQLLAHKINADSVGVGYGDPMGRTPDGRSGTAWTLRIGFGDYRIFVLDDAAYLYSRTWPMKPSFTLSSAGPAVDIEEPPWDEMARIPIALVEEAKAIAENGHVLATAEIVCAKFEDDLLEVYALGKTDEGYWCFRVNGENGMYRIDVLPKGMMVRGFTVSGGNFEPMAIHRADICRHIEGWHNRRA